MWIHGSQPEGLHVRLNQALIWQNCHVSEESHSWRGAQSGHTCIHLSVDGPQFPFIIPTHRRSPSFGFVMVIIFSAINLVGGIGRCEEALSLEKSPTVALRDTAAQLVETMQKVQEERVRWNREKQILESTKEGLNREVFDLKQAIESARERIASTGKDEQEDLDRKKQFDRARDALRESLQLAEVEARKVLPLLPEFLVRENAKLAPALDSLNDSSGKGARENLGKRLQAITLLLAEAEKFQGRLWVRGEEREVDGVAMLVTTIYFGLSVAFSADEQGTVALRGYPGAEGWNFEVLDNKSASARILDLIEVATLKGDIKFVEVPLELR